MKITKKRLLEIIKEEIETVQEAYNPRIDAMVRASVGVYPELEKATQRNSYLVFQGDTLKWIGDGKVVAEWSATSGKLDVLPLIDYFQFIKRMFENKKRFGPIPQGIYHLKHLQKNDNKTDPNILDKLKTIYFRITGKDYDTGKEMSSRTHHPFTDKKNVFTKIAWCRFRIFLKPHKKNNMYGRGQFFLHGGEIEGSAGCIDLGDGMDKFATMWGLNSLARGGGGMPLLVDYDDGIKEELLKRNPSFKRSKLYKNIFTDQDFS